MAAGRQAGFHPAADIRCADYWILLTSKMPILQFDYLTFESFKFFQRKGKEMCMFIKLGNIFLAKLHVFRFINTIMDRWLWLINSRQDAKLVIKQKDQVKYIYNMK